VSPREISIREEGDEAYIEITSGLPPQYRCNNTMASASQICIIEISISVEITNEDLVCYKDNRKIPQLVIGKTPSGDNTLSCGVYITSSNWYVANYL